MPLRIEECEYPSGAAYGIFFMGQHEIGRADKIDGGWKLWRARKVLPQEQAAKAMIDRMISKAREDEKHARQMLEALRKHFGILPPDGSKPANVEVTGRTRSGAAKGSASLVPKQRSDDESRMARV